MKKINLIIAAILAAMLLLIVAMFAGTNNRAVTLEEQITNASAEVNTQEKRRVDLIYNLVDAVTEYQKYEGETYTQIAEARIDVENGNADGARIALDAVAESYPELKANENYQQLMTELAMTENMIAQYRNSYNEQVKSYNKFIRKFPNNILLSVMGYDQIEATYTNYDAPVDAPQNLFNKE